MEIQISKEDAKLAIKLCLANARSFLQDAEILIKNKKLDHIATPIEFALEEIGKAKMIYDSMSSNLKINLSKNGGIYDHKKKLGIACSLINLSRDEVMGYAVVGNDPYDIMIPYEAVSLIEKEVKELRDLGRSGHDMRLSTSFVAFDEKSHKPKLEKSSPDIQVLTKRIRQVIKELCMQVYNDSKRKKKSL